MKDAIPDPFGTGAVRSADADEFDILGLPLVGIIGAARTAVEGTKYGRLNFMQGMPAHVCINHAIRHLLLYGMGDRTEPHLSHASWNCMAAEQSMLLHPELNAPHMPGPGYTLTPAIVAYLDLHKADLAAKRKSGFFADAGKWVIDRLADIRLILDARAANNALSGTAPGTSRTDAINAEAARVIAEEVEEAVAPKPPGRVQELHYGPVSADKVRDAHRTLAEAQVANWAKEEDTGVRAVVARPEADAR